MHINHVVPKSSEEGQTKSWRSLKLVRKPTLKNKFVIYNICISSYMEQFIYKATYI